MKNTPLLQILRALPKENWKSLEKYMVSPFCVTHQPTVALFFYLKKYFNDDHALTKEMIAVALGVEPARIYNLNNYLLEAVERYLAYTGWEQDPHLQYRQTITALRQMKLESVTDMMTRYARRTLDNSPQRGASFFKADADLRQESFLASQQQGRAKNFNLQEISDAQDIAFIAERLRTGCLVASHQAVARQHYDSGLLTPLLQFLEEHRYLEIPIIGGYYHGYYAMTAEEGAAVHFQNLKNILESHGHLFSQAEVQDLYLMAINFCIRRFNQANQIFIKDAFDLYRSGLRQGALLENGTLSRWTYNNIALTALHLKEFEWAESFLNEYALLLPKAHREGAYHLNMARYHYERRDLRTAMEHLLHREHDDVLHNLAAKALLSRIYWELDEDEPLHNQLDSIHIYLRRQKLLGYHREIYMAFVKVMRKLLIINRKDHAVLTKLREEIEAIPALAEREWLLRQLN
jgi:hypothetical protein